jgi:nitric oxide reductase NorQ protein
MTKGRKDTMTSSSPPGAAPRRTADVVSDVLAEMAGAAGGSPEALKKLSERATVTPKATTPTVATPPAPPALEKVLSSKERQITRPNGQVYHVRKMGPHDDVEVLREGRRRQKPVLLYSGPGTGKTAMFEAAFTHTGFETVMGTGDTEVADFLGGYVPVPGGGFRWVDGPLVRAMEGDGENGLPILIDEIALIDPRVMAVVYGTMDGRGVLQVTMNPERELVVAKPGFYVVGACNPRAPGARMSEALLSRFPLHVEVGVDFQLMKKMGVPTKFVTVAQNLKKKYDSGEISWWPAIREMLDFKDLIDIYGEPIALSNVISSAPEIDRPQVADVLTRGWGDTIKGLEIK